MSDQKVFIEILALHLVRGPVAASEVVAGVSIWRSRLRQDSPDSRRRRSRKRDRHGARPQPAPAGQHPHDVVPEHPPKRHRGHGVDEEVRRRVERHQTVGDRGATQHPRGYPEAVMLDANLEAL